MYKRILVTLDGSETAEEALRYAEELAEKMGSEVDLLRVSPRVQPVVEEMGRVIATVDEEMERISGETNQYLNRVAQRFITKGVAARTVVRFGDAADQIVSYAKESETGLIVMCTHGRTGIGRLVYGSVAESVLRSASTPVLLVRASGARRE